MEINDGLLRIQTAIAASQGRITFEDIFDFIYGRTPTQSADDSAGAPPVNDQAAESALESDSDTDDEIIPDYGPGKVKATPKMWRFLNQMRDAPTITMEELNESELYEFTFQTEVLLFIKINDYKLY